MHLLYSIAPAVALLGSSAANPIGDFADVKIAANGGQYFSVKQVEVPRSRPRSFAYDRARSYWKHGVELPEEFESLMRYTEADDQPAEPDADPKGKTTVPVKSAKNEAEFLLQVKVGKHEMWLDPDTGSADLWVFSTLLGSSQRGGRPANRVYDTAGGQQMQGHSWQIRYGDRSTANGQVYLDAVTVGALTVPRQAVEAAATVSASFSRDPANDGLLGLAFSGLNTVKPAKQKTWFDNIRGSLAAPVFCANMKRHAAGTYDFGFIDKAKVVGPMAWIPVKAAKGFWDLSPTGISVNGQGKSGTINAIVDTGSSLWYMPKGFVDFYWNKVQGAQFGGVQRSWMFPCNAKLPDITVHVNGANITVPGINMNYQTAGSSECFGGLQPDTGMPFSIFGDVFMKHMYVCHEHAASGGPRLGIAASQRPS